MHIICLNSYPLSCSETSDVCLQARGEEEAARDVLVQGESAPAGATQGAQQRAGPAQRPQRPPHIA